VGAVDRHPHPSVPVPVHAGNPLALADPKVVTDELYGYAIKLPEALELVDGVVLLEG